MTSCQPLTHCIKSNCVNRKLHFEDGFLYGHDDAVLRVNRRKKTAEVRLEIDQRAFWIGYIDWQ